ncbi:MAG: hypothetical protein HW374_2165, partial [Bacteroidetes bacterium]|nr:hypothetical protein [Bacteroidota bacterium]
GFEPSIEVTPYAGLANLCLQPLGHLSEVGSSKTKLPKNVSRSKGQIWTGCSSQLRENDADNRDRCSRHEIPGDCVIEKNHRKNRGDNRLAIRKDG